MSTVYLGLGSNLGDRLDNIEQAVASLEDNGILILKQSTIIETEPVGGPPQEKFLNAVVQALTDLAPDKLLTVLKSIEKQQGRVKTVANGPRPIDLDILLYDDIQWKSDDLVIPHPRMRERDFVMEPLAEIEPQLARRLTHENHSQD